MKLEFTLYMLLFMTLVGVAQDRPDPHDPNSRCMQPETARNFGPAPWTIIECACHQTCVRPGVDEDDFTPYAREDPMCSKYCAKQFCLCHVDQDVCGLEVHDAHTP